MLVSVCFYTMMSKPLWCYKSYNPGLSTLLNFPSPTNQAFCIRALHKIIDILDIPWHPRKNEPLQIVQEKWWSHSMSFLFGVLFQLRSLFSVVQKWWHTQEFLDLQHIRLTRLRKHELFVRKLQQKRCPNHQELRQDVTTVFLKTQVTSSSISQLPRVRTISGASYQMAFNQWFISGLKLAMNH